MLSRFDDYPVHQTPEPVAHPASGDRNVYDRYWLNGYADDGELYFAVALGLYPNRDVMDCGFSIVRCGEQHSFHASRRAPHERDETRVGPFRLEIVEPMRRTRVVLEPNETGIECDLLFGAKSACVEEGRQTRHRGGRVVMDVTRFAQFGRWQGEIRYHGQRVSIQSDRVLGTKDRSWGVRPVGERNEGGAPPTRRTGFFFLWAPIHWDDHCTHFGIFEDHHGVPWHSDGAIVPSYATPEAIPGTEDAGIERMASVAHRIQWASGTRRSESAEIELVDRRGERRLIQLEPMLCFQMKGIGYSHPEWGHGRWKGELAVGGESWKSADLDPLALENLHVQQVVRARCGDRTGMGVFEQLVIGPHARYGFEGVADGAR